MIKGQKIIIQNRITYKLISIIVLFSKNKSILNNVMVFRNENIT